MIEKRIVNADDFGASLEIYSFRGGMHIDSHHHVHHIPSILPSVIKLAQKYGFKSMRISRNIWHGVSFLK